MRLLFIIYYTSHVNAKILLVFTEYTRYTETNLCSHIRDLLRNYVHAAC
jgi:hypothetical protein